MLSLAKPEDVFVSKINDATQKLKAYYMIVHLICIPHTETGSRDKLIQIFKEETFDIKYHFRLAKTTTNIKNLDDFDQQFVNFHISYN